MNQSSDYVFFPGCMIPLRHQQIELAARKPLPPPGIGLKDVKGFRCCTEPWNFKGTELKSWLTVAMIGEKAGGDMLVLCNGCNATRKEASHIHSSSGKASEAADAKLKKLKLSSKGKSGPKRTASILAELSPEQITRTVKKPLKCLRFAVHRGCHLLRPSDLPGFDDPFEPSNFESLVEALGAEVEEVGGKLGNFKLKVRKKARYVDKKMYRLRRMYPGVCTCGESIG